MKNIILFIFLFLFCDIYAETYYVSTTGNDSNSGLDSTTNAWLTWGKAFSTPNPGDTVYFRGGVYPHTVSSGEGYRTVNSGTPGNYIYYLAYPNEVPILDSQGITPDTTIQGSAEDTYHFAVLSGVSYARFKGLHIRNVWSVYNGVKAIIWRSYGLTDVRFENCNFYNVHGIAFEVWQAYDVYYINCDAYNCSDSLAVAPQLPGNRGTGFSNLNRSTNTGSAYYINCRAWNCGDQGFTAASESYVEWNGCWSFLNGGLQGGGFGIKMSLNYDPPIELNRKMVNCLLVLNRASGATTNDKNKTALSSNVYNNTSYLNGRIPALSYDQYGFYIYKADDVSEEEARIYKNNIAFNNVDGQLGLGTGASYTHSNNTWDSDVTVTADDFKALPSDSTELFNVLAAPRKSDGSLPDLGDYFQLAEGSDLIDAGTDVGLPYNGTAPDLGPFEYSEGSSPTPSSRGKPVSSGATLTNGNGKTIIIKQ